MTAELDRRYRRLLWAYPDAYRHERGEEIVGTLLEMSGTGRRWPAPREAAALVVGGVLTRTRMNRQRPAREIWHGGLRLGVLFLLAHSAATALAQAGFVLTNLDSEPPAEIAGFVLATICCAAALVCVGA